MTWVGWLIAGLLGVLAGLLNLGVLMQGRYVAMVVIDVLALAGYVAIYNFYGPPRARTLQWWLPLARRLRPWGVCACMLLAAAACLYIGLAGIAADECAIFAPGHARHGRWFGSLLYGTCLRFGSVLPGLACTGAGTWLLVRLRLTWPMRRRDS